MVRRKHGSSCATSPTALRADTAVSALRESNELLRALTDAAFEAVVIHRDGEILIANHAAELAARVEPGGLVGRRLFDFIAPESIPMVMDRIREGNEQPYEAVGQRSDGTTYPLEVQVRVGAVSVNGAPARVAVVRDVSERRKLEEQVRQTQKMEAIGKLAGGIAHDFNNLLAVILSAASLASSELDPGHPGRESLDDVCRAAERAAELTHKLLAFGRKQVLHVRLIDVNVVLRGMESMMRRLVAEDVILKLVLADNLGPIAADPVQLELMMLNLVANSRDAMPEGGTLTVSTREFGTDEVAAAFSDASPGPHVVIAVSDDGSGMDAATKARIFEPFFTTKEAGQGTGLGLATVFGIVKQSGGSILVESEPQRGTTFTIGFPRASGDLRVEAPRHAAAPTPPGAKTILVVEDDAALRKVLVVVLQRAGYEVLGAAGPAEALEQARLRRLGIDLLLTDVVMPHMSGRQLASQLTLEHPETLVLYMSGYTNQEIDPRGVLAAGVRFLPKPFTPQALLAMVADVLA